MHLYEICEYFGLPKYDYFHCKVELRGVFLEKYSWILLFLLCSLLICIFFSFLGWKTKLFMFELFGQRKTVVCFLSHFLFSCPLALECDPFTSADSRARCFCHCPLWPSASYWVSQAPVFQFESWEDGDLPCGAWAGRVSAQRGTAAVSVSSHVCSSGCKMCFPLPASFPRCFSHIVGLKISLILFF